MKTNKITKITLCLLLTICCFIMAMTFCSRQEPTQEQVRSDFFILFPDYEVISIEYNESEVVAVSFDVICRKKGSTSEQRVFIQYIDDGNGWEIKPKPTLPN
ncbi:MAG: hypothetical protein HY819_02165 [Acidobacteria bacterium]|nr:hypothetical protein [Acidobacteriota bacterium]